MNNAGVAYGEQAPAGSTSRPQTLDSPGDSAFDDIGLGKAILLRRSALLVPLPSVRPLGVGSSGGLVQVIDVVGHVSQLSGCPATFRDRLGDLYSRKSMVSDPPADLTARKPTCSYRPRA